MATPINHQQFLFTASLVDLPLSNAILKEKCILVGSLRLKWFWAGICFLVFWAGIKNLHPLLMLLVHVLVGHYGGRRKSCASAVPPLTQILAIQIVPWTQRIHDIKNECSVSYASVLCVCVFVCLQCYTVCVYVVATIHWWSRDLHNVSQLSLISIVP